jgi:DHA1 family inner membrane transport protein
VFLLAYGVATAVGSFGGGRFADRNAGRTLIVGAIASAGSLAALYGFGGNPFLVALSLLALGALAMGMGPSLQYRVVTLAGPGAELAQSLPASAINLGVAFGSFAGGVALGTFTTSAAVLTGLVIAVVAVPVAWATGRLEPSVVTDSAPVATGEPVAVSG